MAKGRMVSNSISTSVRVSNLADFDALLFTWIIPHCDDFGRMDGEPAIIKGKVVPLREQGARDVGRSIERLVKAELISQYEIDGRKYIEVLKWEDHQAFRTDRPRKAEYPPKTDGVPTVYQDDPRRLKIDAEVKLSQVKLSQVNKEMLELFWKEYPNKASKNKTIEIFRKLSPDEKLFKIIMANLLKQKESDQWKKEGGKYIPYPTTWLNQERWNDELLKVEKKPYYKGDPIVLKNGKRYVVAKNGEWLIYAGKESEIEYK